MLLPGWWVPSAWRFDVDVWPVATVMAVSVEVGFEWLPQPVPAGMPVVQVYCWLLDDAGRVLVQDTGEGHNLPGGTPEPFDVDLASTAVREVLEESQVRVADLVYLGHERSVRRGEQVALVRTVGRITEFLPRQPDVDGGQLLGRLMTSLAEAPALLGWGRSGVEQARAAARIAETWWDLPVAVPTLGPGYVH